MRFGSLVRVKPYQSDMKCNGRRVAIAKLVEKEGYIRGLFATDNNLIYADIELIQGGKLTYPLSWLVAVG